MDQDLQNSIYDKKFKEFERRLEDLENKIDEIYRIINKR